MLTAPPKIFESSHLSCVKIKPRITHPRLHSVQNLLANIKFLLLPRDKGSVDEHALAMPPVELLDPFFPVMSRKLIKEPKVLP